MQENNDYRTGRHSIFKLYMHLVFTPKYRKKIFTDAMLERLEIIMREKCKEMEAELIRFNGESFLEPELLRRHHWRRAS